MRPINPASAELKTNQPKTDAANLPANPRFTKVAQAGLKAAKIKIGTNRTKNLITDVVPEAIAANVLGNKPPKALPKTSAKKVHK